MKRFIAAVLSIIMLFSLCACGGKEKAEKYCSSCGAGISKEVAFCEHCGAAVGEAKTEDTDNSSDNSETDENTESNPTDTSTPPPSTPTPTHTHSYSHNVTAPTCTAQGYTTHTCSCGDTYKDGYTNPSHNYSNYKCTSCGLVDKSHAYDYLVLWVKKNGTTTGTQTRFAYESGNNSYKLTYDAQSNLLSASLTTVSGGSFCFTALYLESCYYGCSYSDNNTQLDMRGYINANTFTTNTAISYTSYNGDSSRENLMANVARTGVCSIIDWLDWCLDAYDVGITIKDLGFKAFS